MLENLLFTFLTLLNNYIFSHKSDVFFRPIKHITKSKVKKYLFRVSNFWWKKRNKEIVFFFQSNYFILSSTNFCGRHQIEQRIPSQDTDFHIFTLTFWKTSPKNCFEICIEKVIMQNCFFWRSSIQILKINLKKIFFLKFKIFPIPKNSTFVLRLTKPLFDRKKAF